VVYFPWNLFQLRHLLSFRYNLSASDYLTYLYEFTMSYLDLVKWYKETGIDISRFV